MARIYLNGLDLGVIDLKAYNYSVNRLEACGYKVVIL